MIQQFYKISYKIASSNRHNMDLKALLFSKLSKQLFFIAIILEEGEWIG